MRTSDGTLDVVDEDDARILAFDKSLSEEFTVASGGDLLVAVFSRLVSSQWLLNEIILAEWIGTPGDFEGCPGRSIAVAKEEARSCKRICLIILISEKSKSGANRIK